MKTQKQKKWSIIKARKLINDHDWKKIKAYPEFFENGSNSINCEILSEKNMQKLIQEKTLAYCMLEDRYVPSWAFDENTQTWKL